MTGVEILVLCRANRCRSPLFAEMLRAEFARSDLRVRVTSAGFLEPGRPVTPASAEEAAARGLDVSGHVSRRVARDDVRRADLVLAMGLEQLREVVALEPGAWPRAHTVRGFLGRSAGHPARVAGLRGALETWHAGRRAADLVLAGSAEDVPDPVGGPREGYAAMGRTFDELVPAVAAAVLDAVHAPAVEG